jgi:hypothetical protein
MQSAFIIFLRHLCYFSKCKQALIFYSECKQELILYYSSKYVSNFCFITLISVTFNF